MHTCSRLPAYARDGNCSQGLRGLREFTCRCCNMQPSQAVGSADSCGGSGLSGATAAHPRSCTPMLWQLRSRAACQAWPQVGDTSMSQFQCHSSVAAVAIWLCLCSMTMSMAMVPSSVIAVITLRSSTRPWPARRPRAARFSPKGPLCLAQRAEAPCSSMVDNTTANTTLIRPKRTRKRFSTKHTPPPP